MEYTLMIESIDESIFLIFLLLYVIWRVFKVPARLISSLKLKKRGITSLLFLSSVVLQIIYNILLSTVGNILEIDRDDLELLGKVNKEMIINYKGINIDLVKLIQISLIFSRLLRTTVLFWIVNFLDTKNNYFTISRNVRLFCNFYGILRIPIVFFFERYVQLNEIYEKFLRSLFFGTEIYIACFLILIGGLKEYKGHNLLLLMITVLIDTMIRYTINIIILPFEITSLIYHILLKALFITMFTMNILIANIVLGKKIKKLKDVDDLRVNGAVVEYNDFHESHNNNDFMV
ncbi:hypothetical protein DMUE_5543 [Dictyocoela muelleri]|nr:hypothetical protein DMUE_5543 [Dictyocoela muelleri]